MYASPPVSGSALRSSPGAVAGRRFTASHRLHRPGWVAILARRGGRAQDRQRSVDLRARVVVAILARRGGRAQAGSAVDPVESARVAILARRGGRAQARRTWTAARRPPGCDPRPARWPGAGRLVRRRAVLGCPGCDPRPARWPGAGRGGARRARVDQAVAILARRGGRAQAHTIDGQPAEPEGCDPRPARWPGAGLPTRGMPATSGSLRSSPGAVAGRRLTPAVEAADRAEVAILARRGGRAQDGVQYGLAAVEGVAILARRGGRAQVEGIDRSPGGTGVVAILARRGGRAQVEQAIREHNTRTELRSSPGAVAGRSSSSTANIAIRRCVIDPIGVRFVHLIQIFSLGTFRGSGVHWRFLDH